LLDFIHGCIPTLQAAEVLLFLAARPDRWFTADEVVVEMRPLSVTVPAVKEYLAQFVEDGLVAERSAGYSYGPISAALEQAIVELGRAYNERPVTLITVIHHIADRRIRSFSDSFKLRDD
jgi:predicted transcriptional regulator